MSPQKVFISIEIVRGGYILTVPTLLKGVDENGDGIDDVITEVEVVSNPRKLINRIKTVLEDFKQE